MAFLQWNDSLSVNVTELDNHHKKLIDLINSLHDSMLKLKTKEILGAILEELVVYTKKHFSFEEKYIAQIGYPYTAEHIKEHEIFVEKISGYKKDYEAGHLMLSMDLMTFLKKWLIKHIQVTDKKYAIFLDSKH